jgi:hypothetical protein
MRPRSGRWLRGVLFAVAAHLLTAAQGAAQDTLRYDGERATVTFEDTSIPAREREEFARLVDRGVRDVEAYLRPAAGSAGLREGRIDYRVGSEAPYAMTRWRTVFLPVARVRDHAAPYLHEAVHVLVRAPHRSVWLSEGFASFVESHVAENVGGYDARVFTRTGNTGVDGEARRWLAQDRGRAVVPWVGATGEPPGLDWDRRGVAAPFYVLSQSFVKFLIARVGLPQVLRMATSPDPEGLLARESGRTADVWKAEWQAALRAGAPRADGRAPTSGG